MKKRKAAIIFLTFALCATSAGALAACRDNPGESETPPEYTFEDGRPDGEVAEPDEGFKIDGVLDEAAYSSIKWLEGPVLRPYYTSDGQGIYYDYDLIQEKSQSAAQVKMGTYYGENGLYLAYSYKEQEGKVCYVNPTRSAYRNSGVELHIGIPASVSMTGDETISRLTVNANGALTIAKTQGDTWMAPFGTIDEKNMPYVGLTGNGTRTDENADRTEYTFELFIPWGYFDEVGGEGTSDGMKAGGDLVVAPGIITANNYTGTGQTDREYYVLSSRLDDGTWSDAQGWYHFNKEGVVAYDIDIVQPQNGVVQEWMGYDTAPTNSSVTFVIKADEGYALKEFRVNGVAVPSDQIHFDMYTSTGVETEEDMQKAYVRIPQRDVTGDLRVEAVFEPLSSGVQTLTATVYGASTDNPLANTVVTFKRGDTVISGTTDANGSITLEGLTAGLYEVSVSDTDYKGFLDYVFISPEANAQIVFEVNSIALEGIGRVASSYTEIYGEVGSLEGGFVFSGFFGYEGADYDDLVNFTNTVYFVNDVVSTTQTGFRFTKWGNYLMVKYENAEYHFEADAEAVAYFKENSGVYFTFAVDGEGNVSAYIRRSDTEWMLLETNTSVSFPVDLPVESIRFAKQDDSNGSHVAVLKDGSLKVGTGRVDIPVSFTLNGEAPQEGGMQLTGGKVDVPANTVLGDNVTITMTPESDYIISLKVDGQTVTCQQGANGTYTYSFRATSQNYAFEAAFVRVSAQLTLNAAIDPALGSIADDLTVNVSSGSVSLEPTREGTVYTTPSLPYGAYTIKVTSKEGGYTVLERNIVFEEGRESFTLDITADNYGANRKYELWGENNSENGVSIAETIGMPDGYVFEGFLGVGGIGRLSEIGSLNYATALRFTTESGYQYRVCLYIWNGQYWLIKVFEEGKENSAQSHEFAFTENVGLIDYIKEKNGITVNIGVDTQGNFSVYAMTNETDWISLGSWQMTEYEHGKIEKVELLRMFNNGLTGWTAIVEGEIGFGSADVKIPVTVHGMEDVTGGTVEATSANIGEEVTLTLTPDDTHVYGSLMVDGVEVVGEEGENGVYTYTFATTKSSYQIQAIFADGGNVNISASIDGSLGAVAGDLEMVLTNDFVTKTAAYGGSVWTFSRVAYGTYTLTVYSKSGDYIVLTQEVSFSAGAPSASISITPDNYGDNRKYALNGAWDNEGGTVLWEKLGAPVNGFVFEGFLGVGGSGNLNNIGSLNYATALRFTTDSGYQYRICFYIWEGRYWLVKVFEEGLENQPQSHEFGFSDNTALIDYVKAKNGITVKVGADTQGNFTVYAMTNETDWISLGSWQMPDYENGKIEKVELLRMFQKGLDGWTATVDGTLSFGSAEADIPVTVKGTENVTGGTVEVSSANIGENVTLTLTPDDTHVFGSLKVDGVEVVGEEGENGVYTYTFATNKSSYQIEAIFADGGDLTISAAIDESVTATAEDLTIVLTNGSVTKTAVLANNVFTVSRIAYGTYTLTVYSKSGDYTVLTQEVTFGEGSESATVEINAENYGDNREYALNGEWDNEGGTVLWEKLGAPVNGFVFEGFLGVGGSGDLDNIGSLNYATALRFTTESGYQYRVCFYIWEGRYWIIKVFEEGQENSAQSHEFGFTDNTELIDYVKAKNGITVKVGADTQGNFTVYAMTSETDWISLGSWQMTEYENGKIEKVELLRMFQKGLDGWTATVDGTLSFGSAEINIPVTVNGTENVTGGKVEATSAKIGEEVTLTLTPDENYAFISLTVDGEAVSCTENGGVYTYTFTAIKSSYTLAAEFEKTGGTYTVNVSIDGSFTDAANDLQVVLVGTSTEYATTKGEDNTWTTTQSLPYGEYTIRVTSVSGDYIVLEQQVTFEEGSESATVNVTAENYGDNRKYALNGAWDDEGGAVILENLGAPVNGYVFEGFLGVGGSGDLKNIGSLNYATALRFTTDSDYQYRVCFYIWNGRYWIIKVFEEGQENSAQSHEFGFSDNTALIDYVKAKNGITVNIGVDTQGNFTVYAMTSETDWISLGSWRMTEYENGKIEKVELLRMFQNGLDGWMATVDGTLSFGSAEINIPVTVNGTENVTGGKVEATSANIGEQVTITLTPDESHVFGSLKVDGQAVTCQADENGVYIYTFTATKSSHQIEAVFAEGGDLTITVTGVSVDSSDLTIEVSNGSVTKEATLEGGSWTVSRIAYGTYTITVSSKSGGYTVLTQEVNFEAGSLSAEVEITAENYGDNRKYELQGQNDEEYSGGVLAEDLGSTESFVFKGFLGIKEGGESLDALKNSGNGSFGAGLRFIMSDGNSFRIAFVANNGTWSIRCYWQDSGNSEHDNVALTMDDTLKNYVSANGGVNIIAVAEKVGGTPTVTIFVECAENTWQQLGTYANGNVPLDKAIEQVTIAKMWINNNPNRTSYAEGTLSFGTTDTGIAVSFSGTGSVTGGTVSTSDSVELGEEVTVTLTPEEGYVFTSLNVDGARVECTAGEDGVYTYTFTANKNSYTLAAVFELAGGTYTVNVSIDGSLTGAAEDLKVVLVGASTEYVAAEGEGNTWTTESIPYGTYTLVVTSVSGGYTVFEQQVTFEETSTSTTVNVTAENWGANREYVLNTNDVAEEYPGETLAENLGAPTGGFVFEGFLGINAENATTGNEEGLANLGSDSFGTSIRFTTSNNDYKWRIALVRTSNQWEIRCYQESGEDPKYQYYFTDLDDVVSYVTQENGAHIMVSLSSDKQLTVYIQKSATEWVSLGTQSVIFNVGESIEKVEAAIMWVSVFTGKGWTGVVDGELRFGTTDTGVEVSFTGTGDVTNGNVSVSEAPELGKEVTVTLTPSDGYMFRSLKVDGTIVACTADESGVYIYTFTATKNSYQIEAAFAEGGDLTITVVDSASASDDLKIEVTNGSVTKEATLDDGTWTVSDLPYGDYTVIVYSLSGGYTVLMQEVNFEAGSLSAEVTITTDNYGDNRKYALNGAWDNESGTVILENLGAPVNGYVFEGFLGVGGSGSLNNIGSLNYATALRFTTEEGYQYRVCFYIWNGQYWLIKVFEEGKENSAQSHEFAFTGNTALINYVKEKNGITVNISVDTEGNFSVYAMTSDNVWTSLGSWQMTEYKSGKIEKVELLRMFQNGLDGWTATVDGTLSFGTTDTGISDGSENAGK